MRAVITGATGGIGGATAEALGRAGYEVIIKLFSVYYPINE